VTGSEGSVSQTDLRLALRAELAELELRLLDKLVTKAEHESLVTRHEMLAVKVASIEAHGSPQAQTQHGQIAVLQSTMARNVAWRNRMAGAITVLSFFAALAAPVIFHHYF
jgi:hypothetical protein